MNRRIIYPQNQGNIVYHYQYKELHIQAIAYINPFSAHLCEVTVNVERFTGLNFHGFQEYHKKFP